MAKRFKSIIAIVSLSALVGFSINCGAEELSTEDRQVFTYTNPLPFEYEALGKIRRELRDPCIVRQGDTYYLVFTVWPFSNREEHRLNLPNQGGSPGIKLYSSRDLKKWKFENWLVKSDQLPEDCPYKNRFWAPEIHKIAGRFFLIFTADNWIKKEYNPAGTWGTSGYAFVGVADNITGPYINITYLDGGACDTSLFEDTDGKTYAVIPAYNVYVQQIDLSRIAQGRVSLVGTRKLAVQCSNDDIGLSAEADYQEGPWMFRKDDRYFLLYAGPYREAKNPSEKQGYWASIAYADNVMGPWKKDPRGQVFHGGHTAVFEGPDDRFWFSYRWEMNNRHRGLLCIDPITIDENGLVQPSGPSDSTVEVPVAKPSSRQTELLRQWEELKFGMFIHYGLSTFTGDWQTNKNASPAAYAPSNLDVRQWVRTARRAGMKYAVLTAKHTLGHCLWDSSDYAYDVATSTDKTDVIDAFIRNCWAEGIKPGLYYCILDIYNEGGDTLKWKAPVKPDYFKQIKKHLTELHTKYSDIFEQWIDIPHKLSSAQRWELYRLVKKLNPDCLVIMNAAFRDGVEIFEGAWPTDLANGEVTLPPESGHQPIKVIQGKQYYIPMEVCDTLTGMWFWHPEDRPRSPRHLYYLYSESIRRGANLLLNVSPDRTGRIPDDQVKALMQLKEFIDNPTRYRPSIIKGAKTRASNVFQNDSQYSPDMTLDNKWNTRWDPA